MEHWGKCIEVKCFSFAGWRLREFPHNKKIMYNDQINRSCCIWSLTSTSWLKVIKLCKKKDGSYCQDHFNNVKMFKMTLGRSRFKKTHFKLINISWLWAGSATAARSKSHNCFQNVFNCSRLTVHIAVWTGAALLHLIRLKPPSYPVSRPVTPPIFSNSLRHHHYHHHHPHHQRPDFRVEYSWSNHSITTPLLICYVIQSKTLYYLFQSTLVLINYSFTERKFFLNEMIFPCMLFWHFDDRKWSSDQTKRPLSHGGESQ